MALSDLCLSVFYGNDYLGPYNFIHSGEVNGKPYWENSSGGMTIQWNSNNTYWEVVGWSGFANTALRSQNNVNFPTSNWKMIGRVPKNNVIVTSGTCGTYTPLSVDAIVTDSSCSSNCDGVIVMNVSGGKKPYLFSIDNGITYTSHPIFTNLCPNNYAIKVSADTPSIETKNVSVNFSENENQYAIFLKNISQTSISTDTLQTTWVLTIEPPLQAGHILSINLNANLDTIISKPGNATTLNTLSVYKNNTELTPSSIVGSTSSSLRPYCSPYENVYASSGLTYSTTLVSGDTLTGITTSIISNIQIETGSNGCSTKVEQKNLIRIMSAYINTCKCCQLIYTSDGYGGINSHIR